MPEFWQKSARRARETLTFWRRFLPALNVGGTTPDQHQTDLAALETLAQAHATCRTEVKTAKQAELAHFNRIRTLNLALPRLIAGQFDEGHALRLALAGVYRVVPRSAALNLRRARLLIPVWKAANDVLAASQPGAALTRGGAGVADFEKLVTDYPAAVQAHADALTNRRSARTALRQQHRQVDRMNKRAYLKFKSEAGWSPALWQALRTGITREKSSSSARRSSRKPPGAGADPATRPMAA